MTQPQENNRHRFWFCSFSPSPTPIISSGVTRVETNIKHPDVEKRGNTHAYLLLDAALRTFWLRPFQNVCKIKRFSGRSGLNRRRSSAQDFLWKAVSEVAQPYYKPGFFFFFLNLKGKLSKNLRKFLFVIKKEKNNYYPYNTNIYYWNRAISLEALHAHTTS